jgi:hypothetical protein
VAVHEVPRLPASASTAFLKSSSRWRARRDRLRGCTAREERVTNFWEAK